MGRREGGAEQAARAADPGVRGAAGAGRGVGVDLALACPA